MQARVKRNYVPVSGVQQRKKLLKELGRATPRKSFSASAREARKATARMFGFTPLISIKDNELFFLKKFTHAMVKETSRWFIRNRALPLLRGRLSIINPKMKPIKPERKTILELFSNAKKYQETELGKSRKAYGRIQLQSSRGLLGYREQSGIDVLQAAMDAFERKGSKVKLLDVGSSTAKMLAELKSVMKEKIETHSLSPEDEPREKTDFHHMLVAEFMPKEFKGKFDAIISHRALEYALLPHHALRNIASALAAGGEAHIQWFDRQVNLPLECRRDEESMTSFYAKQKKEFSGARSLIEKIMNAHGIKQAGDKSAKALKEILQKHGFNGLRYALFLETVDSLGNSRNFEVIVKESMKGEIGFIPVLITIKRKA